MNGLLGGVEAGGTKFNCVVARGPDQVLERTTIPTGLPADTLAAVVEFFRHSARRHGPLAAIGVASFGPVELDRASTDYGLITNTPKEHWSRVAIVSTLERELAVPVAFETDVNGAALGEGHGGAADGLDHYAYVTIGTGIGAGLIHRGRPLHGFSHPEVGHMLVPRHSDDDYPGQCPFHGDCLEGLACGPALRARWGRDPAGLPADHPAWEIEAFYLASMCVNLVATFMPRRIILGGGVMAADGLLQQVRHQFCRLSGNYFQALDRESMRDFLVIPGHQGRSGEIGALILARGLVERE
ncbi:MAG: ROK family protein [Wenzhouxiangella sp.]